MNRAVCWRTVDIVENSTFKIYWTCFEKSASYSIGKKGLGIDIDITFYCRQILYICAIHWMVVFSAWKHMLMAECWMLSYVFCARFVYVYTVQYAISILFLSFLCSTFCGFRVSRCAGKIFSREEKKEMLPEREKNIFTNIPTLHICSAVVWYFAEFLVLGSVGPFGRCVRWACEIRWIAYGVGISPDRLKVYHIHFEYSESNMDWDCLFLSACAYLYSSFDLSLHRNVCACTVVRLPMKFRALCCCC